MRGGERRREDKSAKSAEIYIYREPTHIHTHARAHICALGVAPIVL